MNWFNILPYLLVVFVVTLTFFWVREIGVLRAILAGLARLLWLTPFVLVLSAKESRLDLPRSLTSRTIHVLVDDSASIETSPKARQERDIALETLADNCAELGCKIRKTALSQVASRTKEGFSPIGQGLSTFLFSTSTDPWVLISDGGDTTPQEVLPSHSTPGLVVGVGLDEGINYAIRSVNSAQLAFEGKPTEISVKLERTGPLSLETVQVQVAIDKNPVTTSNIVFESGKSSAIAYLVIPPQRRGQYLLSVSMVGVGSEKILWDNTEHLPFEVLPNTLGVLHLLGSPDWDGRFFRRFLKSEPKYDLVSFYILRDPWDAGFIPERELSLIPFPVERLFNEELASFRVLTLQNFTVNRFLQPELASNLIEFVKAGGGALIIGGPRAFLSQDLSSSALADILPFEFKPSKDQEPSSASVFRDQLGVEQRSGDLPWYDENLKFRIKLANPSPDQRALASVFDDLATLQSNLDSAGELQGLHHMENVKFKSNTVTPLLDAQRADGQTQPLVLATYPGKGRALWVFSDRLWELALSHENGSPSRNLYNQFSQALMTWLLREDIRKPLTISDIKMSNSDSGTDFNILIQGPALRYLNSLEGWVVSVCDRVIPNDAIQYDRHSSEEILLGGGLKGFQAAGLKCQIKIDVSHQSFGAIKLSQVTHVPEVFTDRELPRSTEFLKKLSNQLQSTLVTSPQEIKNWLTPLTAGDGVMLPPRSRLVKDHYWSLENWWLFLMLLGMPLEVLARRWEQLTGGRKLIPFWKSNGLKSLFKNQISDSIQK